MKIAVAADGKSLDSTVSEKFENCKYLLIINVDNLGLEIIENRTFSENLYGEFLADEILKYDCEAVITGSIHSKAFNILADACVTRYIGAGYSAKNAIELMDKNFLKLITCEEGQDKCNGDHHH